MIASLLEAENDTQRDTQGSKHVKTEAKTGVMMPQPKNVKSYKKLKKARKVSSKNLQRKHDFAHMLITGFDFQS